MGQPGLGRQQLPLGLGLRSTKEVVYVQKPAEYSKFRSRKYLSIHRSPSTDLPIYGRMQRELIETDIGELALLCTVIKVDRRLLLANDKKAPAANNLSEYEMGSQVDAKKCREFGYSSVRCFEALSK